jgi:hypothetical protein
MMNHERMFGRPSRGLPRSWPLGVAVIVAAILWLAACGGGENGRPSTQAEDPGPVPAAELTRARAVVVEFVEALGAGEIKRASSLVGAVSEERANETRSLEALLRESTEGHGAWAAAAERVVIPIGIDAGLVAVMLEGTLQVEGTTEHRIEVFPVRKAESADAWFVEPWAYDLRRGRPIAIVSPIVDDEELATVDPGDSFDVTVRTAQSGHVSVSVDAGSPSNLEVEKGEPARFTAATDDARSVVAVFTAGPTLTATGFRVRTPEDA